MDWSCPECGSEDVQKYSVKFEAGAAQSVGQSHTTGVGMAFSRGTIAVGGGKSTTANVNTVMTAAAMRTAPPKKISLASGMTVLAGGFLALTAYFNAGMEDYLWLGGGGAIAVVIGGIQIIGGLNYNWKAYYEDLCRWQNMWFCNRCGHSFHRKQEQSATRG